MPELVCELIVTLDGFAGSQRSPGYFGYFGPDFEHWVNTNGAVPHQMLIGRKSYELFAAMPAEVRDEGTERLTKQPGFLFSRMVKTTDWSGLTIVHDDMVGFVRDLKQKDGDELRTLGSISLVQQLLVAGLVDRLKLVVCPLILPQTGTEPYFKGLPDMGFDLVSSEVLDGRVLLLEYHPAGAPPYRD